MSAASRSAPFAARTIAILVAVSLVAFFTFLVLSAYGGELRPARNGGAHALSTSAVGFSGTAELIRLTGRKTGIVRSEQAMLGDGLLILTPGADTTPQRVREILDRREGLPTLIVLPKWIVASLPGKRAWVQALGQLPPQFTLAPLKGTAEVSLEWAGRGGRRSVRGDNIYTLVRGSGQGALLAQIEESEHYILADPDALNNRGLASVDGAREAIELLDAIAPPDEPIEFDVTLAGFGRNPNLLKLAFEAPFLPLTLCLLLAAGLAVLHALRRFGPAAIEARAVAFGKRAIAENGAALLRLARRRHRTGERYAALTRDAVASATGAPSSLTGETLDRYLDKLTPEGEPFTRIAARAADAPDTRRLLQAARDLYHWRRTVTRDHR